MHTDSNRLICDKAPTKVPHHRWSGLEKAAMG